MAEWIADLIGRTGYLGVALLMLLETIVPPIPSEVIMPLSGLEAGRGRLNIAGVIAAGTAGAMLGNYVWYVVARRLGIDRFRPLVRRHGRLLTIKWRDVERADDLFDRHGRWFVFLGRMTPTIRSLVSVPAGLFGMKPLPFLFWSTLGTAGWSGALAMAGYLMGSRYDRIEKWLDPISTGIVVLLVAGYLWRVIRWRG